MTVVLAVVPRHPSDSSAQAAQETVDICARSVRGALGPRYAEPPQVVAGLSTTGTVVARWEPPSARDGLAVRSGRWVATSAPATAPRLLDAVTSRAGTLLHSDQAWGTFAAIMGDRGTNRLLAWNTVPTLEAIHWAEDGDFFYVSNRPLVIATCLAAHARRRIRVSHEYLLEVIDFGFPISGLTPYEGVRTLPPRRALSINGSEAALVPAPLPPPVPLAETDQPLRRGSEELVEALRAATRRHLAPVGEDDRVELRLSGGVDSRLLLGLLREAGIERITAVCQGSTRSEEVRVAAQLAELARVDFVATTPDLIDPTSVRGSMRASIVEGQGYIPTEALVSPYAIGGPDPHGETLTAGQWPLFKGVLERSADNALATIERTLGRLSAHVLTPEHDATHQRAVRAWAASVPATTNYEFLYMWGRDLRSSRYLQPHAVQVDRERRLAYPFVDSQVTAVADALPSQNRRLQLTSFFAIEAIWPEALAVPLAGGGRFRFEASTPMEGISGEHYAARTAAPPPFTGTIRDAGTDRVTDPEMLRSPLTSAARLLVRSPRWRTLRRLLSPEFRALVVAVSKTTEVGAHELAPADQSPRWLRLVLWRLLLADLWLEGDWLPPAPRWR